MDPFAKPPTISDDYRPADIYRQSAEVFHEKGFEATSMAEIAESVDLTQGGLYYYIKGKTTLLFAIMNFAMDLLETEVLQPARRLEDPEECLDTLVAGYVRLVCEEPSVMALLAHDRDHLEKTHAPKIRARMRLYADFLRDVIASILYEKQLADAVDPGEAAEAVIEMIQTVRQWNEGGRLDRKAIVAHILEETITSRQPHQSTALAG